MIDKSLANTKLDSFEFPVERGKIKEFANAICDPNPVFKDQDYARNQGFADVIMPVTFPITFVFQQDSDNAVLESALKLGMDPARSVHGEVEFIYERPVFAGETLRGEIWIGNIYEKAGKRGGTMTFVEHETRFFDGAGKLAVTLRNIFIEKG